MTSLDIFQSLRCSLLQTAIQCYSSSAGPTDVVEIAHLWEHYILDGVCGDGDEGTNLTPETETMQ